MRNLVKICCLFAVLLITAGCHIPDQAQIERLEKLRQTFKQLEKNDTVYKTGIMGKTRPWLIAFSVSPDGKRILFSTGSRADSVILFDLVTGQKLKLPEPENSDWGVPVWSGDGKQLVATATPRHDRQYQLDAEEAIVLNPHDWSHQVLASSPGIKDALFFSFDQKTVYYFKGKRREPPGKTFTYKYDLYAYDLNTNQETRLTTGEIMFQVRRGYDDGQLIYFSAIPSPDSPWKANGASEDIFIFNKTSFDLKPLDLDRSDGFFFLDFAGKSKCGDIYFTACKDDPAGGNYLQFIYRCDQTGQNCTALREITNGDNVLFVPATGDIFIASYLGDEIIFRKSLMRQSGCPDLRLFIAFL